MRRKREEGGREREGGRRGRVYSNYEEKRGRRREGREGERVYSVYEGREGEERERESLTCKGLSKGTIENFFYHIHSHSILLTISTCTCIIHASHPSYTHSHTIYLS